MLNFFFDNLKEIRTRVVSVQKANRHDAQRVRVEDQRAHRGHELHEEAVEAKRKRAGAVAQARHDDQRECRCDSRAHGEQSKAQESTQSRKSTPKKKKNL